MKKKLIIH